MKWFVLVLFIVVLQGVGAWIGLSFPVDDWYISLNKSVLTPPGYVFGIVWPILYVLIAIAGWRVFMKSGFVVPRALWLAQIVFNFSFNPIFFGAQNILLAVIALVGTFIFALGFVVSVRGRDNPSALLFLPYLAWLCLALYLILFIWVHN